MKYTWTLKFSTFYSFLIISKIYDTFESMKKETTYTTQCVIALEAAILDGEFLPGAHLRNEELKKLLGVGLSPIREALSKLAERGLLNFEENRGYFVAKKSELELRDTIESFSEIECLCLVHSMDGANDDWEAKVIGTLHKLKKIESKEDLKYEEWAPINAEFHRTLVSACPLKGLLAMRDSCSLQYEWYVRLHHMFADGTKIKTNQKEHQTIAKHVLDGETEKAIEALSHHINAGTEPLIQNLVEHKVLS